LKGSRRRLLLCDLLLKISFINATPDAAAAIFVPFLFALSQGVIFQYILYIFTIYYPRITEKVIGNSALGVNTLMKFARALELAESARKKMCN